MEASDAGETEMDFGLERMRAKRESAKPKLISTRLEADIQSFRNLSLYETSESLCDKSGWSETDGAEQAVNYTVAVFDATK